jgi:hypothetical protein
MRTPNARIAIGSGFDLAHGGATSPRQAAASPAPAPAPAAAAAAAPAKAAAASEAAAASAAAASAAAASEAAAAAVSEAAAAAVSEAAAAAMSAAAAAAMSAAAASSSKLYVWLRCSEVFLVEDMERRQADVENFFLTESKALKRRRILRRYIRYRSAGRCRPRHPRNSQDGYSFIWTLPLRSALRLRHRRVLLYFPSNKCATSPLHSYHFSCAFNSDMQVIACRSSSAHPRQWLAQDVERARQVSKVRSAQCTQRPARNLAGAGSSDGGDGDCDIRREIRAEIRQGRRMPDQGSRNIRWTSFSPMRRCISCQTIMNSW